MLRRIFNRVADSFDKVNWMVTRKLPVPDLEGTKKYVQFTAQRGKDGYWTISSKHNMTNITAGFQSVSRAYHKAAEKHADRKLSPGDSFSMNFDTAFLILKDMEDSLLSRTGTTPGDEPKHHFMHAYRLLPKQFREGLDDLLFKRTELKGRLMEPKPRAQPEAKPQPGAFKGRGGPAN
ncbi:MAG: hypothetical protein GC185_03785 [Alphaproteobacteria bacterium]|nr:hypothetical protein [Alphaproteobacteria bacterium]